MVQDLQDIRDLLLLAQIMLCSGRIEEYQELLQEVLSKSIIALNVAGSMEQ